MDIEKMFEGEGGYVFVSHSHLDLKEVREVRNFLETNGMEPILFYLRSMEGSDEEKLKLLQTLIYDEIDSREFFLYLESENSKKSQWVQEEIRYVNETAPDKVVVLPLAGGIEQAKKRLEEFIKRMRVFISASAVDRPLVERLKKALLKRDFRVYTDSDDIKAGGSWAKQMKKSIHDVAKEGAVLVLLTERSMQSVYVQRELFYALRCKARVFPIVVGDAALTAAGLEFLQAYPYFHLENVENDGEWDELVDGLKRMLKK